MDRRLRIGLIAGGVVALFLVAFGVGFALTHGGKSLPLNVGSGISQVAASPTPFARSSPVPVITPSPSPSFGHGTNTPFPTESSPTSGPSLPPGPARGHDTTDFYVAYDGTNIDPASTHPSTTSVSHDGVGQYSVSFGGDSLSDGDVQVGALGDTTNHCNVKGWGSSLVHVTCWTSAEAPVDSAFGALFTRRADAQYAYVTTSGAAPPSWNRGGATATTSDGGKTYQVIFGASVDPGNVQVTPYGSSKTCSVSSWSGSQVQVFCTAPTNIAVLWRAKAASVAYAWGQAATGTYDANPDYYSNPGAGQVSVQQTGTGTYTIHFTSLDFKPGGYVHASAYGSTASCAVANWGRYDVYIRCTADTRFSVLYI